MGIKILLSKHIKDLSQVLKMSVTSATIYYYVVEVVDNKLVDERAQNLVHHALESVGRIGLSERHDTLLV